MLCEVGTAHGFFALWIVMTVLGLGSMLMLSGAIFYPYYGCPTFERWKMKSNPKFPSPELVKKEIIHMCKGLSVATLCPAFTLMASKWGYSQGYCGAGNGTEFPLWVQCLIIFAFSDFSEYYYHYLGHKFSFLWSIHRHHHMFYNPSPFAVIADEYLDQFIRTMPLVILPMALPINMDLMFAVFAVFFYGYGVYLHWGYEAKILSAHNPVLNTSYHHYMHHAISAKGRLVKTHTYFVFVVLFVALHLSNFTVPPTFFPVELL
jgi:Delta7-sterol 5-desaturase